ncbi:hypothetical protein Q4Q35_03570 [Flavivirga aquimarina]|uniref:Uncharacterized protein n=1 Tax=Flavivirga aquimarina TaxID=2027862 RepID=A0ABT8W6Y8_9FLAO|nr:hypothetical protein [Flavivirga aquimarina]MDO5968876.1 hypothetical protein [Flavivirga aquimarina]
MAFKLIKKDINPPYFEAYKGYTPNTGEKLVFEDEKTGELYAEKPGFSLKSRKWKYLVVDSSIPVGKRGYFRKLESLDDAMEITLKINYNFRLLTDIDIHFLREIMSSGSLHTFFESRLNRWIDEFLSKNPDFISDFFQAKKRLLQSLRDTARTKGILLEIALLDDNEDRNNDEISGVIDIKTSDYYGRVSLNYTLDCEIKEDNIPRGKLSLVRKDILKREVRKEIRESIESIGNLKLHTLYFDINKSIRSKIENKLEKYLSKKGLRLTFIHLKIDLPNVPLFRERFDYTVEGKTKNTYPISINHSIILTLEDLGKYYSSGITEVVPWVKKEMTRITQDYIFEHNFTELVIDFQDQWIRDEMRKILENKGYRIKQLITIPDLEKVVPDTIEIEIGDDLEFETKRNDVKVKIGVQVNGKVNEIERMKDILHPKKAVKDIVELIKKSVVNEIRLIIHAMEPQHFYMHFDHPSTDTNEAAVSEQITKRIIKLLEVKYGIAINTFICKSLETNLEKKFREIHMRTKTVEIESKSGEINETVRFDVVSVFKDGWHIFKAKCDTLGKQDSTAMLDDIAKRIKDNVESALDEFRFDFVAVKNVEFKTRFFEFLRASAQSISEDFGLGITFSKSIGRGMTSVEKDMREELKAERKHKRKKNKKIRGAELKKLDAINTNNIEMIKLLGETELKDFRTDYKSPEELEEKRKVLLNESLREKLDSKYKDLEAGEITKDNLLHSSSGVKKKLKKGTNKNKK